MLTGQTVHKRWKIKSSNHKNCHEIFDSIANYRKTREKIVMPFNHSSNSKILLDSLKIDNLTSGKESLLK